MSDRIVITIDPDIAELVPGFLANRARDVMQLRAQSAAGRFAEARVLGHSMKGAGGGYGFDEITNIGARIEQAAKAENAAEINLAADALQDYLARVDIVAGDA